MPAGGRASTRRSSRCIPRGLTTGDIRAHLGEIYGVEVSRDLISRVTDGVADELHRWTSRDS
jgi:transposase-like protein